MVPSQNGAHQGCDPTPRRESMRRWGGRKRSSRVATARRRKKPRTQGQCTTGRIGCTAIAMRHLLWFSSHDSIMAAAVLYKSWLRLSNKNLVVQPNLLSVGWTTHCPPLLWPPAAQEHGPAFYHQVIRLPEVLRVTIYDPTMTRMVLDKAVAHLRLHRKLSCRKARGGSGGASYPAPGRLSTQARPAAADGASGHVRRD